MIIDPLSTRAVVSAPLIDTDVSFVDPTNLWNKFSRKGFCWRSSPVCPSTETPISFPTSLLFRRQIVYLVSLAVVFLDLVSACFCYILHKRGEVLFY